MVVLVTGVGRAGQIGHAVARGLGRTGCRIVMAGRDDAVLGTHAKTFTAEGIDARGVAVDLATQAGAGRAVAAAVTAFGGLDAVVNLAGGFGAFGPTPDVSIAAFDSMFEANVKTAFCVSQAAIPVLRQRGGGAIVNFASVAALTPMSPMAAYAAAKTAVAGLTRSLARELRDDRIRVNAVAPGLVRTADNVAQMGADPKARWVELDQVVAAVHFLISPDSAAVTGQLLAVTAGDV